MTPDLDPNSDAKILQKIFCNPILQTHKINASRGPNTKYYTFLESSHDTWLISKLNFENKKRKKTDEILRKTNEHIRKT